jgi:hypothetical protein
VLSLTELAAGKPDIVSVLAWICRTVPQTQSSPMSTLAIELSTPTEVADLDGTTANRYHLYLAVRIWRIGFVRYQC